MCSFFIYLSYSLVSLNVDHQGAGGTVYVQPTNSPCSLNVKYSGVYLS